MTRLRPPGRAAIVWSSRLDLLDRRAGHGEPNSLWRVGRQRSGSQRGGRMLGTSMLPNGAPVTRWGWAGWWFFWAGLAIAGVETALIEWGPGTWPVSGMPWIGIGLMGVGAITMIFDITWVALHDRWVAHRTGIDADLVTGVPALMAARPDIGWEVAGQASGGFVVDLWLVEDPARTAQVRVVGRRWRTLREFSFRFAGFESSSSSPLFQANAEMLSEFLSQVVTILRGPTIIEIERAGSEIVLTTLRNGPDPANPWILETGTYRPFTRLLRRTRGEQIHRETSSYAAARP